MPLTEDSVPESACFGLYMYVLAWHVSLAMEALNVIAELSVPGK